jgi:hypothetical protein
MFEILNYKIYLKLLYLKTLVLNVLKTILNLFVSSYK